MIVKLYIYGRILSPIQMLIRLKSLSFLFTKSIDYTVRFATVYYSECVPFETAAAEAAPVPGRPYRAREIKESRRFVCFTFETFLRARPHNLKILLIGQHYCELATGSIRSI